MPDDKRQDLPTFADAELGADARGDDLRAAILVLRGADAGKLFRLTMGETIIGRDEDAQLRLRDQSISRMHAQILSDGSARSTVCDLGSTNGTLVESIQVGRIPIGLNDGDRIHLGRTVVLKYTLQDDLEEEVHEALYNGAIRDALTQVFNKRYLNQRLGEEIAFAHRHQSKLSMLVLDLDHFKAVNDTYGHNAGDAVLQVVADCLLEQVRTEDVVARFGGEEFVVLLRDIPSAQALILAERLRAAIERLTVVVDDAQIQVSASIGLATLHGVEDNAEGLFQRADQAMYRAKETGRNCVTVQD